MHRGNGHGFGDQALSEVAVDLLHVGDVIQGEGSGKEGEMGHGG
jgi:hypothetical protein